MKAVIYSLLACLVVAHCGVTQYTLTNFVEQVRQESLVPSMNAISDLASNNSSLNTRIERARQAVQLIKDENVRLKSSLKEGVEMLKDEIVENNKLNQEIDNLNWRIQMLEDTIDKISPCDNKESVDEIPAP